MHCFVPRVRRSPVLIAIALLLAWLPIQKQAAAQEREAPVAFATPAEKEIVLSAIRSAIAIIQDISRRHAGEPVSDQLDMLTGRMTSATSSYGGFRAPDALAVASPGRAGGAGGADELSDLLVEVRRELRTVARDLDRRGEEDLANALLDLVDDLTRAVRLADELAHETTPVQDDWRTEIRDRERVRVSPRITVRDSGWETDWDDERDNQPWRHRWSSGWQRHSSAFVGEFTHSWPYGETAQYRPVPALRYNRVEGLVLGVRRLPLDWSDYERARLYGQVGYAFSLEDWRYEVGIESKLSDAYGYADFDLKIGGAYHKNTGTDDVWKTSWAENSLAASLFRFDFFDYYETEGWTIYAVGKMTPYVQISVGYREDDYVTLTNETTWSLFGGDPFRFNPAIDEGRMKSVVTTLEGGRIRGYRSQPSGVAFRLEAEFGKGLGGDFSFTRYVGDLRTFARMGRHSGLSLRLRGGYADGDVPVQKAFTLGGVGSVRAYLQNIFFGTRMLLANAEYTLYRQELLDELLEDFAVFGLFDAGWTNAGGVNEFDHSDMFAAAGFGVSLDDRTIRLEVAWPLRDFGTGTEPSIWLRLNPTF